MFLGTLEANLDTKTTPSLVKGNSLLEKEVSDCSGS